jgi:hypothetical protein
VKIAAQRLITKPEMRSDINHLPFWSANPVSDGSKIKCAEGYKTGNLVTP